jgi:hypothetical protein
MSATYRIEPTRSSITSAFRPDRMAGIAGLAFAILVALVNVIVGAMSPPAFDAPASDITAFVAENKTALTAALGAVPAGVVTLYLFLAGSFPRFAGASEEASFWARFGAVGLILVEVMFVGRTLFELALIANVDRLAGESALVETLWQLQAAAMIATGLAIGIALVGLSRAARLSRVIPGWQEKMGFGAALAFFIAAVAALPSLEGSPIGLLGLPAFVTWLVWLAMTSIRLLRQDDATA